MSAPAAAAHPVDRVPRADRMIVLGAQHVLIMYSGCVAVPLIVGGALHLPPRRRAP